MKWQLALALVSAPLLWVLVGGGAVRPDVPDFEASLEEEEALRPLSPPTVVSAAAIADGRTMTTTTPNRVGMISTAPTSSESNMPQIPQTDKFWTSFFTALAMIIFSEMGDKTFLIATIMAMRHPRLLVFAASQLALSIMTVISAAFGLILPNLIPREWTQYVAAILFLLFGLRMIREGWTMSSTHMRDEYEEVTLEIEGTEEAARRSTTRLAAREDGRGGDQVVSCLDPWQRRLLAFFSALRLDRVAPIAVQTFTLTFLAEWGDRSQIATIALAAAQVCPPSVAALRIAHSSLHRMSGV